MLGGGQVAPEAERHIPGQLGGGQTLRHGSLLDGVERLAPQLLCLSPCFLVLAPSLLADSKQGCPRLRAIPNGSLSSMGGFREALVADLDDTQGGTTQEGVHLGAMAGSVDILTRNFAGLQMRADRLIFAPHLPEPVNALQFQIRYRGQCVDVALNHHRLRLVTQECTTASGIQVDVWGKAARLGGAQTKDFPLA